MVERFLAARNSANVTVVQRVPNSCCDFLSQVRSFFLPNFFLRFDFIHISRKKAEIPKECFTNDLFG